MRWILTTSGLFSAFALVGLGFSPEDTGGADTLTIGAYSVVREAFHDGLFPAFREHWRRKTGRDVRFEESYNASGAQARAIASGFDADVAVLSQEGDVDILVKAGVVKKDWKKAPHAGMVSRSLVVVGVRPGNPKSLHDWEDLTRPGVGVLCPDPKTSGGARWNVNAIYGAGLLHGNPPGPDSARDLLRRVKDNIVTLDPSGRQSMATFERGTGDAVITYENELLLQRKMRPGDDVPFVIPPSTLLIESPAAIVETSVERHGNREVAEEFLAFLRSREGQAILAEYGFRPLDAPLPEGVFTMKELGGWSKLKKTIYETGGLWDVLFTERGAKEGRR